MKKLLKIAIFCLFLHISPVYSTFQCCENLQKCHALWKNCDEMLNITQVALDNQVEQLRIKDNIIDAHKEKYISLKKDTEYTKYYGIGGFFLGIITTSLIIATTKSIIR